MILKTIVLYSGYSALEKTEKIHFSYFQNAYFFLILWKMVWFRAVSNHAFFFKLFELIHISSTPYYLSGTVET